MGKKTKGQEEIREKVALLLGAETPLEKIIELTGVSELTHGSQLTLFTK